MIHQQPSILLITGNMAAGKSTIAQAVAERLPKSVHLRGDIFRRMIVNGRAVMNFGLTDEAQRQLDMRYALAVAAAKQYCDAGFTVIYQDIIIGAALDTVIAAFQPYPLQVVVLCPRAAVIAAREDGRGKAGYQDRAAIDAFEHVLQFETPRRGYWLDTSDLDVNETVDRILTFGAQPPTPPLTAEE